jgi:tetratricopeptide (TPR) repeat protein
MLAAGALGWWLAAPTSVCEQAVRSGDARRGVELCLDSYERSRQPRDLAWAAKAYLQAGDLDDAERLARRLLAGPLFGDAHSILSYVALRSGSEHAGSDARNHATIAWIVHLLAGDERGRMSDAVSLAQAAWKLGDFAGSLQAADEALRLALRLGDPVRQVAAQLARADVFRRIGDTRLAAEALSSAVERATTPCDRAWAHLKSGLFRQEIQDDGLAIAELDAARTANARCGARDVATSASLTRARLLRSKDPSAALALLDNVASSEGELVEIGMLRGHLAADRGALGEADRYFERAERLEAPDADWPWDIARTRAELAELRGGLVNDLLAELHYRRSIAMVSILRAKARAHTAFLVASHRAPYDGLIALLARYGRWREVLATVLALDASDMLRATADGGTTASLGSPSTKLAPGSAAMSASVDERKRVGGGGDPDGSAGGAGARPRGIDDVLAAWRGRDLVIVIAPARRQIGSRERAYRLRIARGQVTGDDVGDAEAAIASARDLFADPGNRQAARALGRMMVPAGPERGTLHVLAIGALAKVPLAALRDGDGALSIGRRPLVRVLGLLANGPEPAARGRAVVIADPRGDLPSAAIEGQAVAQVLGAGTQVFGASAPSPATRASWWSAGDAELLHVATHVIARDRWRELPLVDGTIGPADIVERRFAPRIAVLAGCGSGAATDEEGWGSIAAALVESGTAAVIATDRTIDDRAALTLMRGFYAQRDWRTEPARALARVQQQLGEHEIASDDDAVNARSWAAFFVLGRPPAIPSRSAR